jgi:predicted DsbA family dithiol-disulfide isomerase
LDFNYETSVVANTYNAHRLIQFTKTKNLDNKIEEALLKAQFSDGKNIDDLTVLAEIGTSIGLDKMEVEEVLSQKDKFASEVAKDLETAKQLGIRSVPFFVFNDKYGVSGAQPSEAFTEMLEKVWKEFSIHTSFENLSEGKSCSIDGDCD